MAEDFVIEMLHITKEFPGIKANDDITLQLRKGEVHALLGENGAGKSTLMSVLFGLYQPEAGKILKNGKARSDMSAISMAISQYHFEMKAYPKTLNDLTKKSDDGQYGPWIRRIEQDPWGHAYSYTTVTDGANGEYYLLVSGGADGTVQTTKLPSDTEKSNNDDIVVVSK